MSKRVISKQEIEVALRMYNDGADYNKIAVAININPKNVSRTLRSAGVIPSRRAAPTHPVNEEFFDRFTEDSAYVIGLFVADGSFEAGHTFRIYSNDNQLLVDVAHAMRLDRGVEGPFKNTYRLSVNSRKLASRLADIVGQKGKKVGIASLPKVPHELANDLLRGLFDGDGHIGLKPTRGAPSVKFTNTSLVLLQDVKAVLSRLGIDTSDPYAHYTVNPRHKTRYDLEARSNLTLRQFYDLFYGHDPSLFLSRKKNRFESYMSANPS